MVYDVIVIGAGASGLMAAGAAAEAGAKVLLLEKMETPARKVRITGKGRCNITNTRPWSEFSTHIRAGREFFVPAFQSFDNVAAAEFFRREGVPLVVERGDRVFPASGKAVDVACALEGWCRRAGAEIACRRTVRKIVVGNGVTGVEVGQGEFIGATCVILCSGGVSYPATGSTGDGYAMAHAIGHDIEPLRPSLVALRSSHPAMRWLDGLQLKNIRAELIVDSVPVASEFGEMEFMRGRSRRSSGIEMGGAVIMRLSRDAVDALAQGRKVELSIDLKPALSPETLESRIGREIAALGGGVGVGELLRKLVPSMLIRAIAHELGRPPASPFPTSEKFIGELAKVLKDLRFTLDAYAPFEEAVVTAGGIDLMGVDPLTLESMHVHGLYFAGEVLDIDADTGGYNLQIAFSTGQLAGVSAAAECIKTTL